MCMKPLRPALNRFGPNAALIHADLGGHNLAKNDAFARASFAL